MPITHIGSTSNNVDNASSMSLPVDGGVQDGDYMELDTSCDGNGFEVPTGFTLIAELDIGGVGVHHAYKACRIADNEPASITINTVGGTDERGVAALNIYRGQKTTGFLDQVVTATQVSANSATIPAITPTEDNELVTALIATRDGNSGSPILGANTTSLSVRLDNTNGPGGSGSGSAALAILDEIQTEKAEVSGTIVVTNGPTDLGVILASIKEQPDVVPGGDGIKSFGRSFKKSFKKSFTRAFG